MHIRNRNRSWVGLFILGILLTFLSACGGLAIPGFGRNQNQQGQSAGASTQRVTVTKGTIENRVIGTGKVVARKIVDLPFLRSGAVTEMRVKEGDQVKKGQVLAQLDVSDQEFTVQQQWASYLSAQAAYSQTLRGPSAADIKAARAAVASAQAAYTNLNKEPSEADLAAAKADLMTAEATLRVKQQAYDKRAARDPGIGASQEAIDLETATNNYNKAKSAYDAKFVKPSAADYASASSQIAQAQKTLAALSPIDETVQQAKAKMDQSYVAWQQAQAGLKNAALIAPIDGLITVVNIDQGEWANSGSAALEIADMTEPLFEISLDEADLNKITLGQDARIQLQSSLTEFIAGKVESISNIGTDANNIVTYKVRLRIPRSDKQPRILLGMSGTSEIISSKIDDALLIPTNALVVDQTQKAYFVLRTTGSGDSATTERIKVEIGARTGDQTQIVSGVNVGDVLAVPIVRTQSAAQGGPPPGP